MGVSEPRFEADDGLAIGVKAKMTWFNDPRVNRPDRDLVQAFTFSAQELVGSCCRADRVFRKRVLLAPTTMVEPRAVVGGILGFKTEQVMDRTLQPTSRWMSSCYGREAHLRTG